MYYEWGYIIPAAGPGWISGCSCSSVPQCTKTSLHSCIKLAMQLLRVAVLASTWLWLGGMQLSAWLSTFSDDCQKWVYLWVALEALIVVTTALAEDFAADEGQGSGDHSQGLQCKLTGTLISEPVQVLVLV